MKKRILSGTIVAYELYNEKKSKSYETGSLADQGQTVSDPAPLKFHIFP
jgi:hypothetical protein